MIFDCIILNSNHKFSPTGELNHDFLMEGKASNHNEIPTEETSLDS